MKELFSIGYQGYRSVDLFVNDLKYFGVKMLVDVRSVPYSRYYVDWNKENLERRLAKDCIGYVNLKREFGARQENPVFYRHGRLDFDIFRRSDQFLNGIERVHQMEGVCLMCMEKLPSTCHRSILIGRALYERGCNVQHITEGRKVVSQFDIAVQLVKTYFKVFEMDVCYVNAAYELQNNVIGYKK